MQTATRQPTGQYPVYTPKKKVPVWVWIVSGIAALFLLCGVGVASLAGNDNPTPIPNSSAGASSENVFHYGSTATVGKFAVTVTPIDGYVPGEYAAGYTGGAATAYQVTVRNDSEAPINLFSVMIDGTIEGGQPADEIFDSSSGIDWAPNGELFPGESATFKIAFNGAVARVKIDGFLDVGSPAYFVP